MPPPASLLHRLRAALRLLFPGALGAYLAYRLLQQRVAKRRPLAPRAGQRRLAGGAAAAAEAPPPEHGPADGADDADDADGADANRQLFFCWPRPG